MLTHLLMVKHLFVKGVKSLVYYTIGTGIGAGAIQNGEFIGGMGHTEAGHVYVNPLQPK